MRHRVVGTIRLRFLPVTSQQRQKRNQHQRNGPNTPTTKPMRQQAFTPKVKLATQRRNDLRRKNDGPVCIVCLRYFQRIWGFNRRLRRESLRMLRPCQRTVAPSSTAGVEGRAGYLQTKALAGVISSVLPKNDPVNVTPEPVPKTTLAFGATSVPSKGAYMFNVVPPKPR